jgi:AraC-like DNA-binding protein
LPRLRHQVLEIRAAHPLELPRVVIPPGNCAKRVCCTPETMNCQRYARSTPLAIACRSVSLNMRPAQAVSASRSAFAERFTTLIGQPPMQYLTLCRLYLAAQKLRESRRSVSQIGISPTAWRAQVGATGAGD